MSRSQVRRATGRLDFGTNDTGCTILHVDMDAFFAAVSLRRHPELRGRPVIIGGRGVRSVVLSATYEARALGVHSAMPMGRALRLAPTAIVLEPDGDAYRRVSRAVMAILHDTTDAVEQVSVDEAFVDVSGSVRRLGPPVHIARSIRERVRRDQEITCSIGVAPSKFVAKLASTRAKPDGLLLVPEARVIEFLHPLAVGELWGVGERTEHALHRMGLETVGELAHAPIERLTHSLGRSMGTHLHELAWGRDRRAVSPHVAEKSVSNETTFDVDVADLDELHAHLLRLSDRVAARLRSAHLLTRTVSIKVRFPDFRTVTRSRTLTAPTDVGATLHAITRDLLDALVNDGAAVRLLGVRAEGLVSATAQQLSFDDIDDARRDAEVAVDRLRERFGSSAVQSARLLAGTATDADDPKGADR